MECRIAQSESERQTILDQRYRVFVEECRYLEPSDPAERIESDPYDAYALFFGVWEGGELIGSCRLILPNSEGGLPTLTKMIINENFTPDMGKTAEISRIIVAKGSQSLRTSVQVLQHMQHEIYRISLRYGIEQWIGAIEPAFLRLLHVAGLPYTAIGPLQPHIRVQRYPVVLTADAYLNTRGTTAA